MGWKLKHLCSWSRALEGGLTLIVISLFLSLSALYASPHVWSEDEVFEGRNQRVLEGLPEPTELERGFLEYVQAQNFDFQESLKKVFLEAVQKRYLKAFKDCVNCMPEEIFLKHLSYVIRQVRKKTAVDDPDYNYLALKIAFRLDHETDRWKLLRDRIYSRLGQEIRGDEEVFWEVVEDELYRYEHEGHQLYVAKEDLLSQAQLVAGKLRTYHTRRNIFRASLRSLVEIVYGSDEDLRQRREDFLEKVDQDFDGYAQHEAKRFIERAENGHLRGNGHAFKKVRFSVIKYEGQYQLIAKAECERSKSVLFAINPPHKVGEEPVELDAENKSLKKYAWSQSQDVLVIDLRNGDFKPVKVYRKPSIWNPKRYIQFFRAKYSPSTAGTQKLALTSAVVNGGVRSFLLYQASQANPDISFSLPAVGIFAAYLYIFAAWNQFYDNVVASKGPGMETLKKIIIKTPVTIAFLSLTNGAASPLLATLMSLPINFTEKLGSTHNRRLIRMLDREGELRGDFHLQAGHFNPVRWAQLFYYSAKEGKVNVRPLAIFNPMAWVKKSHELAKVWNDNIELRKWEKKSIAKFTKPVGLREGEGYLRNGLTSGATTVDQALGFPISLSLQVIIGEVNSTGSLIFAYLRRRQFAAEGNDVMVHYYDSEITKIKRDLWYIPGVGRVLNPLLAKIFGRTKKKNGCKEEVAALASDLAPLEASQKTEAATPSH